MNSNSDFRKKRKAEQRQRVAIAVIAASIVCAALGISALAFQFTGQETLNPATALATEKLSPTLITQVEPAAASPTPAALPPAENLNAEIPVSLSLPQKVGQMLLVGVGGKEITATECQIIRDLAPGGIAFHGGNVTDPQQLSRLIAGLKNCANPSTPPMFFAMDHEGQYINRFENGVSIFPSPLAQGATGNPELVRQAAFASGQELSSMGINMILGPVADVLTNLDNLVIGERAFGGDAQQVGEMVGSAVTGYMQSGVTPVLKHFPGHGGVSVDSHNALPVDNALAQTLSASYFPSFQKGLSASAPVVMLSHVVFPQIDPNGLPTSLSRPSVDLLRTQFQFDGVILTDDINMGALQTLGKDVPTLATESIRAGVDMVIILPLSEAQAAQQKIISAVEQGQIPAAQIEASAQRILRLKQQQGMSQTYPPAAQPDWQANANLAQSIGYQSIYVLKNFDNLIPISPTVKSVFIIAPPDNLDLDAVLSAELQARGLQFQFAHYNAPWLGISGDEALIQSFAAQAAGYDLVLMFTWQAHANRLLYGDTWQGSMVNAIQQSGVPLIVASLKSPTDVLEFPTVKTHVASFGTTTGQIQGLVDVLTGKASATGINPLPKLP